MYPSIDQHLLVADVCVLALGDLRAVGAAHRLVGVLFRPVGDHVGARLASGDDACLHVVVVKFRVPGIGHARRQLAQLRGGGVPADIASRGKGARMALTTSVMTPPISLATRALPGRDRPSDHNRHASQVFPDLASISKGPAHGRMPPVTATDGCTLWLMTQTAPVPIAEATSLREKSWVFFNGEIVHYADAKVGLLTHGLNYGTGVFEGIRGYWNADREQLFALSLRQHFESACIRTRARC